jgi:hypothetical protein
MFSPECELLRVLCGLLGISQPYSEVLVAIRTAISGAILLGRLNPEE